MKRIDRFCAAAWCACVSSVLLCGCDNAARAAKLEIVVPAYFYPSGGSDWNDLNAAASKVPIMAIMNPFNGPGNSRDSNYVSAVNSLRAAGGRVIGYVHTSYTARPVEQVLNDINRYAMWYDVDGIFVDEMTNTGPAERLNYYRDIYNHIKSIDPNWLVMGNPGTTTIEQYLTWPTADQLMVFENVGATYPGYSPSSWNFSYDRSQFVHLVHTEASSASMLGHLNLAVERNAGGIFVTDDVLPNPWNRLPAYWAALVDAVARANADFNNDGFVDAADYVSWRHTDGTPGGYNTWRANFGMALANGSSFSIPVPEPASTSILLIAVLLLKLSIIRPASCRGAQRIWTCWSLAAVRQR
jgi:hypothetical protein